MPARGKQLRGKVTSVVPVSSKYDLRKEEKKAVAKETTPDAAVAKKPDAAAAVAKKANAVAADVEAKEQWPKKVAACAKKANVFKKSLAEYLESIPAKGKLALQAGVLTHTRTPTHPHTRTCESFPSQCEV